MRLAAGVAALLAAGLARAAPTAAPPSSDSAPVLVVAPLCKPQSFRLAAFLDSLRVELAGSGLSCCTLAEPGTQTATVTSLRVQIEIVPCAADADRVRVSVREPNDPRVVQREVYLSDVEQTARPRALALAVAELIRSRGQGVRGGLPEAIAIPVRRARPAPEPSPPRFAQTVALSVRAEAEARSLPTQDTNALGGRAGLTARWRTLHADFDLGGSFARARDELGDVLLRSASAGLGLGPRLAVRPVAIDFGIRAELGWAWIRGEPATVDARGGAGSDLTSSAGLRLSLEVPVQVRIRPSLALEGGGVIRAVKGEVDGQPVIGVTGYYLLAALGMAVSL